MGLGMPDALLDRFVVLHEARKRGTLEARDRGEYEEGRRVLSRLMLAAQQLATPQGAMVRSDFRAACVVYVDLETGGGAPPERATTVDLSARGFAVFSGRPRALGDLLHFALHLPESPSVVAEVSGTARVASSAAHGEAHRIGFVFAALEADAREALEVALVDFVLTRLEESGPGPTRSDDAANATAERHR
jgi:hypothetical protein